MEISGLGIEDAALYCAPGCDPAYEAVGSAEIFGPGVVLIANRPSQEIGMNATRGSGPSSAQQDSVQQDSVEQDSVQPDQSRPTSAPSNAPRTGIVIVDHGSRRASSNAMLETFVGLFADATGLPIVEPAHMELAEPSISTAFDRCVARGARRVVVMPYFLSTGRHWHQDIPRLARDAAAAHEGVAYLVGSPIGLHPQMVGVVQARLEHCLARAEGQVEECESCRGTDRCQFRLAGSSMGARDDSTSA